ncbi:MAG: hypothetical protein DYG94_04820 [Leptolyngbya sp. PLA3]|nr:MAG: hypothetical protein EDM82_03970 [Cyanobacteria bacterium CYA]MCE7968055.1 hypothetical protein [Leptolyngbya sp. PL-A3]
MRAINLLPFEYSRRRLLARRTNAWSRGLVVGAAATAMGIAICRTQAPATAGLELRRTRLRMESDQLLRTAARQAEALKGHAAGIDLMVRIARQPDLSNLLAMLASWCTDGTRLESVSIQASPSSPIFETRITGLCASQDLATVFLECARTSKVFDSITLAGTRRIDGPEGPAYRFELRCVLAGLGEQAEALR